MDPKPYHGHFRAVKKCKGLRRLLDIPAHLLATTFACERLLRPALVPRFQIVGMLLDVLDDVFRLHSSLEPAKRALYRFTLLDSNFGQF